MGQGKKGAGLFMAMAVSASLATAQPKLFAVVSAGEAPYNPISDVAGSAAFYQTGLSLEYPMRFLTPYSRNVVGRFNDGFNAETYLGGQIGYPIGWFKPALLLEAGCQTFAVKRFTNGDDYEIARDTEFSYGLGLRGDMGSRFYGAFMQRGNDYPWWKLEIGLRVY
jgi:hypothetical protein